MADQKVGMCCKVKLKLANQVQSTHFPLLISSFIYFQFTHVPNVYWSVVHKGYPGYSYGCQQIKFHEHECGLNVTIDGVQNRQHLRIYSIIKCRLRMRQYQLKNFISLQLHMIIVPVVFIKEVTMYSFPLLRLHMWVCYALKTTSCGFGLGFTLECNFKCFNEFQFSLTWVMLKNLIPSTCIQCHYVYK